MYEISGKTEFDIFRNFYKAAGVKLRIVVEKLTLHSKNDEKSYLFIHVSDNYNLQHKQIACFEHITESLRHATYNSRAYAIALYKRSEIYFKFRQYEACAIDLKLSLEADYEADLKPRLYIEKANCYAKMRDFKNMLKTIDECYNFMKNCPEISTNLMNAYLKEIKMFMIENKIKLGVTLLVRPPLETAKIKAPHRLNSNISSAINFRLNNISETNHYTATRDIPCGEVLFLEPAYSHSNSTPEGKKNGVFFCDNCLLEALNSIPCRTCVALLYCSENCRINAWNDHHQWECDIFRANFLTNEMILSLRTVIKAACSGVIKEIVSKKPIKPGKNADPYLNMYSAFVDLAHFRSKHFEILTVICEKSVIAVEFLKKSKFISHLMSSTLKNLSHDEVVNVIGGLLLKHNIQALQRSVTVNRASHIFAILDENETKQKLMLHCTRLKAFYAFCPMVSLIPHSCLPNTNIDFHGATAVVKASKNIKAGDLIYRSTRNLSPNISQANRKYFLDSLLITCKCESCVDVKKNCDVFNTFICSACGGSAVLEEMTDRYVTCFDCKLKSDASVIQKQLEKYNLAKESQNLEYKISYLGELKSIASPHHDFIYEMYKGILQLRIRKGNTKKFVKSLKDFQNCSKTKYSYGDPYNYLSDIILICEAFFQFIHLNKAKIKVEEGLELLNIFYELIEEAKNLSIITFPSFLQLIIPLQAFLLAYRINHIYLKMQ